LIYSASFGFLLLIINPVFAHYLASSCRQGVDEIYHLPQFFIQAIS
jgi:hypothetical protein